MALIRSILVPVDFSENSRSALEYAAEFARRFGAELDVLHVWEVPTFVPVESAALADAGTSILELARKAAERQLEIFVATAAQKGIRVRDAKNVPGHPAHAIVDAATAGGYDLLVLGTHGRTGLSRTLIGSVAERVVRHAHCPVLTVRSRELRTPGS